MVSKSEIDAQIKPIRIPFMFMLILVVLISTFIIYTSFKVITLERLPMLGTFRSIGATKNDRHYYAVGGFYLRYIGEFAWMLVRATTTETHYELNGR